MSGDTLLPKKMHQKKSDEEHNTWGHAGPIQHVYNRHEYCDKVMGDKWRRQLRLATLDLATASSKFISKFVFHVFFCDFASSKFIFHVFFPIGTKLPFKWFDYLKQTRSMAAPVKLFDKVGFLSPNHWEAFLVSFSNSAVSMMQFRDRMPCVSHLLYLCLMAHVRGQW